MDRIFSSLLRKRCFRIFKSRRSFFVFSELAGVCNKHGFIAIVSLYYLSTPYRVLLLITFPFYRFTRYHKTISCIQVPSHASQQMLVKHSTITQIHIIIFQRIEFKTYSILLVTRTSLRERLIKTPSLLGLRPRFPFLTNLPPSPSLPLTSSTLDPTTRLENYFMITC